MPPNYMKYTRRKWRAKGYHVEGTEQIRRFPGGVVQRKDLFGFGDALLVRDDELIIVQVTSWAHVSTRLRKIQEKATGSGKWERPMRELALEWLSFPDHRIIIEGWKLQDSPRKWVSKEIEVTPDMLEDESG